MEWTEDTIVRLRELWTEGHSTAEIGRRLGVSKNAIVGKAHRLDLTARPSPIRREVPPPEAVLTCGLHRPEATTLPPLASIETPHMPAAAPAAVVKPPVVRAAVLSVATPSDAPPRQIPLPPPRIQALVTRPYARIVTCCWPIGEPGTRSFRFCDGPSEPGKPYCGEHAKLAYVKVRDRRDDAA